MSAATVGVAEHVNSAELVTIAPDGRLLDRRRIELTGPDLPTHPHHREGSWAMGRYLGTPGARAIPLAEAVALVERVRAAAVLGAGAAFARLAGDLATRIGTIAIRACPALPAGIEARIADHRAQTFADSVMYREALAEAAETRGWAVTWYDADTARADAARALGVADLGPVLAAMGRAAGPPWQARHKLAAAAALAAGGTGTLRASRPQRR
ncbi:MAG: hypothetical protein AB7L66_13395 [Gemmatimonadales bacterium]